MTHQTDSGHNHIFQSCLYFCHSYHCYASFHYSNTISDSQLYQYKSMSFLCCAILVSHSHTLLNHPTPCNPALAGWWTGHSSLTLSAFTNNILSACICQDSIHFPGLNQMSSLLWSLNWTPPPPANIHPHIPCRTESSFCTLMMCIFFLAFTSFCFALQLFACLFMLCR